MRTEPETKTSGRLTAHAEGSDRRRHSMAVTEGPERGAKAQSVGASTGVGLGRGALAPPQTGGLGL